MKTSCAPWGSSRSTGACRGQQPEGNTSGKRKGYKVGGAMESFSGRLCSQGIEGRLTSASSQAFLQTILAQTTGHVFLIHEGAQYQPMVLVSYKLNSASERGTKPDALGSKPCH